MLHIVAIFLNIIIMVFYSFVIAEGVMQEFTNIAPKMKFFFNISFLELFITSLFMLFLPILNIRFIYQSK